MLVYQNNHFGVTFLKQHNEVWFYVKTIKIIIFMIFQIKMFWRQIILSNIKEGYRDGTSDGKALTLVTSEFDMTRRTSQWKRRNHSLCSANIASVLMPPEVATGATPTSSLDVRKCSSCSLGKKSTLLIFIYLNIFIQGKTFRNALLCNVGQW